MQNHFLFPHLQTRPQKETAMENKVLNILTHFICAISANSTLENEEIMEAPLEVAVWMYITLYLYYSIYSICISFLWFNKEYSQCIPINWLLSLPKTNSDEDAGDVTNIIKWIDVGGINW